MEPDPSTVNTVSAASPSEKRNRLGLLSCTREGPGTETVTRVRGTFPGCATEPGEGTPSPPTPVEEEWLPLSLMDVSWSLTAVPRIPSARLSLRIGQRRAIQRPHQEPGRSKAERGLILDGRPVTFPFPPSEINLYRGRGGWGGGFRNTTPWRDLARGDRDPEPSVNQLPHTHIDAHTHK